MADLYVCSHGATNPCDECKATRISLMLAMRKKLDPEAPDAVVFPDPPWRRIRRHEITSERWEELQAALDRPEGPTEAEAEEVLQHYGTSGREVVNGFIERLLSERSSLRSAAQVALHCLQGTGEKTIDQVKVQLRAALKIGK